MGVYDEKLKEVEAKFNELEEMRKNVQEQVANLNRKLSEIVQEQVRLQGSNQTLRDLMGEKKSDPTPEIPKEKSEKERKN